MVFSRVGHPLRWRLTVALWRGDAILDNAACIVARSALVLAVADQVLAPASTAALSRSPLRAVPAVPRGTPRRRDRADDGTDNRADNRADGGTDDGTDRCPGGAGAGDQLALRSITARTGGSVQNRGRGTTTAQVTASIGTGRGNLLHLAAPAGSPTAPIAPSIDVSILVEIGISVLTTDGHASPFRHWLTVANLLVPGRAARRHAVADPCGARRAGSPVSERASLDAEGQGERREERGEKREERRERQTTRTSRALHLSGSAVPTGGPRSVLREYSRRSGEHERGELDHHRSAPKAAGCEREASGRNTL